MATFSESDEALMLAYVYGELSASDARAFERRLDAEPELRAEVEGMRASHELFGKDAAWGAASGVDAPPAHLVDAIVRAEVLARSSEVREAMNKRSASSTTLTAKMARWLLGGGILVAGAAAVLIVVNRSAEAPALSSAAKVAHEEAPAAPAAEPAPAPSPPAAAVASRAASDDAELEKKADEKPRDSTVNKDVADKLADAPPAQQPMHHAAAANIASDGDRGGADLDERKQLKREAKEQAIEQGKTKAKSRAEAKADVSGFDAKTARSEDDFGALGSASGSAVSGAATSTTTAAPRPSVNVAPPPPASPPAAFAAPKGGLAAGPGAAPAKKAPAKPSTVAPAEEPESASADVVSQDELQAAQSKVRNKNAEGAKKNSLKLEAERGHRLETANLSYATGKRELDGKNYPSALDAFSAAEHVDTDQALGALPQLGEMRAYLAMKRPGDAARIVRRIASRDVKQQGVVDALLLGVQAAQQIGDDTLQRDLWTRLLDVPAHRAEAQTALAKLGNGAGVYRNRYDADSAAPAAAEKSAAPPPTATAPAADSKAKE